MIANGYNVAVVEYHGSDPFNSTYASARRTYYGSPGNPTAFFDGGNPVVGGISGGNMYSYYIGPTTTAAAVPCSFELEIYGTGSGGTYDITAIITMVDPYAGSNLVFQLAVTESNIPYAWYGLSEVNHVCRLMVPNANGTALDFSSTDEIVLNLSFTLQGWIPGNCELIPFVQNNSTKAVLQGSMIPLVFLPPPPPPLAAGFSSDVTSTCEANEVQYYDESTGNPTEWLWEFEGGEPATSTDEEPLVTYNTAGVYDVTLTVTKGGEDSTIVSQDYMTVNAYPEEPTITQEDDDLVSSAENGNQWYLEGDIIPDATNQVYTPTQGGNYSVMVTENGCGTISQEYYFSWVGIGEIYSQKELTVFPSPNNGRFTLNLNTGISETVNMRIFNAMKSKVYEEEGIYIDGQYHRSMDLGNLPNGMYFMVIEGLEKSYIRKIIIQK